MFLFFGNVKKEAQIYKNGLLLLGQRGQSCRIQQQISHMLKSGLPIAKLHHIACSFGFCLEVEMCEI